ncbi:hypothetical protein MPTK1_3g05380 [Marchantia polymorpha subsp. ruderalis]|uniref:Uncharacterized protein n=2 Tax=Marchantia polymorpha TaxID=3197 RepID=A0AAF6AXN9_MARPO|nr:hypothetical protein MARPO_0006s0011 [Marchantia polymorpha]BBN04523.1 hypothetical protein Mp_3g05380 [Marchantia polymorpha subsp. ruderalis]|eukprot:PTQ47959.1 hypothetical protein MARPO_0006s0011 [Marchantia polymorpha]
MADDDVEMDVIREEEMESASLLSSSAKEKSASLARAAYRAELASKRAALLAILIIPILVMIVLWHVFDSNANLGFKKQPPHESIPRP